MEQTQGIWKPGVPHRMRANQINFSLRVKLVGKVVEFVFLMSVFMRSVPKTFPWPTEEEGKK
jgi:hypothetical protein